MCTKAAGGGGTDTARYALAPLLREPAQHCTREYIFWGSVSSMNSRIGCPRVLSPDRASIVVTISGSLAVSRQISNCRQVEPLG